MQEARSRAFRQLRPLHLLGWRSAGWGGEPGVQTRGKIANNDWTRVSGDTSRRYFSFVEFTAFFSACSSSCCCTCSQ